jgi:two-component system response regulator ResD
MARIAANQSIEVLIPQSPGDSRNAKALVMAADPVVRGRLAGVLAEAGIECVEAEPELGARALYASRPNCVLFEAGADEEDWSLLARLREASGVPVIAVCEEGDENGTVLALRAGADDCLREPVRAEELVARFAAVMRRSPGASEDEAMLADEFIEMDARRHAVRAFGRTVDLTPTEFRMLAVFLRHPGEALTHERLLEHVWGDGFRGREEVKLYVSYLRRKLNEACLEPIETVWGIGYRYRPQRVS